MASLAVLALSAPSAVASIRSAPIQHFRVTDGTSMSVASSSFSRPQIEPLVQVFATLPHGTEIKRLKLYVATSEEISRSCGEGIMACYDPDAERMLVSGQSEEVAGISRESVIAHEYGHHIANNRRGGGIWPALFAGTSRWATYEGICGLARSGQAFPGDQGAHYWENPGEAFAQAYSQLAYPGGEWHYSPLLRPDSISLEMLRRDVVDPVVGPWTRIWRRGAYPPRARFRGGVGNATAVGKGASPIVFQRIVRVPLDGRVTVRLRAREGRYRLTLRDRSSGAVLARSKSGARRGVARLSYAACGLRSLTLEATPAGDAGAFEARITTP